MKSSNVKIAKIFDHIAPKYEQVVNPYTTRRRNKTLVSWAKGKCLEVGAGTGELSLSLSQKGLKVVACDISPKIVQEIKKKGIEAYVADAEKLPFYGNSFDTIIASELIYYLDRPEKFIEQAYRVLKPGGRLLLSCASANLSTRSYNRVRTFLRNLGFKRMYFDDPVSVFTSLPRLRNLLESCGFKQIDQRRIILFPFSSFHGLNNILEKTIFNRLAVFVLAEAIK